MCAMSHVFLFYVYFLNGLVCASSFFFQAEDGIRDLVRSRGLGDVYKRQSHTLADVLRGPIDFDQLPQGTPPAIRSLLRRCLDLSLIHI